MKNFKKVLSLVLAVLMVVGGLVVMPSEVKAAEPEWVKVDNVDQITSGGEFVIVANVDDKYYAMHTDNFAGTSNSRNFAEVNIDNGTLSGDTIPVWQILEVPDSNYIYLYTGEKYAYTQDSNQLKLGTSTSYTNTRFSVSKNSDGTFGIYNVDYPTRLVSCNKSDMRWACYKGTQAGNLILFKKAINTEVPATATEAIIVDKAHLLLSGMDLVKEGTSEIYKATLTGTVTSETGAETVTISVKDSVENLCTIACTGIINGQGTDVSNITKSATIGVTGILKKSTDGSIYFADGCVLTTFQEAPKTDVTVSEGDNIIEKAGLLADGKKLIDTEGNPYIAKGLTGKITKIEAGVITLTINEVTFQIPSLTADGTNTTATTITELEVTDDIVVNGGIKNEADTLIITDAKLTSYTDNTWSQEKIVEEAYKLAAGAKFDKAYELTGLVIDSEGWNSDSKSICVTIQVGNLTEKPIYCYMLKGTASADASQIKEGDTITISGILKNYTDEDGKSVIEYDYGCKLISRIAGTPNTDEDNSGSSDNENTNNSATTTPSKPKYEKKYETATLIGNFAELIAAGDLKGCNLTGNLADDAKSNAMTYLGNGVYKFTLKFEKTTKDIVLKYKVAFNGTTDNTIGAKSVNTDFAANGGEITITIPAGSTEVTFVVSEKDTVVYDSITNQAKVTEYAEKISKMGDTTNYALYFMLVLAGAGLVAASVLGKKKMA